MITPKVSVVVPCYNVEKYLQQCLDSVVNQTLRDIEIICINDGSRDSTLSIIQEYADKDERIRIIDKPNSGYGHSMNCGFDVAQGEYLGIVEADDFAEPDMFETLYNAAVKSDLDVVKAGFYEYSTYPQEKNIPVLTACKIAGKKVFCPSTAFSRPLKKADFFKTTPAIWSAIYRRSFIQENKIRFHETPGASYQDVGFCFKVWTKAKRAQMISRCLLHYRVDNSQSSVHSPGKVYCICDEYKEMDRFLRENAVGDEQDFLLLLRLKYENYIWNYERLTARLQTEFIQRFYEEFRQHQKEGTLSRNYFSWYDWNNLRKILLDPVRYNDLYIKRCRGEVICDFYDSCPEKRPFGNKMVYLTVNNLMLSWNILKAQGLDVFIRLFKKRMQEVRQRQKKEK